MHHVTSGYSSLHEIQVSMNIAHIREALQEALHAALTNVFPSANYPQIHLCRARNLENLHLLSSIRPEIEQAPAPKSADRRQ